MKFFIVFEKMKNDYNDARFKGYDDDLIATEM